MYFDFSWVYESVGNERSWKIILHPLPRGMKDHATILKAHRLILGFAESADFDRLAELENTGEWLTYVEFFI